MIGVTFGIVGATVNNHWRNREIRRVLDQMGDMAGVAHVGVAGTQVGNLVIKHDN